MKESHLSPTPSPEEADSLFGPTRNGPPPRRRPIVSPDPQPEIAREIRPIETHYAGCRFRSRLEARWAVFFDHLGISWQYEPEGYEVGPETRRRRYLPDFYLPREGMWVEVKGHAAGLDAVLLLHAAHPIHGLPLNPANPRAEYRLWEPRLLLLGPIPNWPAAHDLLSVVGKDVVAIQYGFFICGSHSGGAHGVVPIYAPSGPATSERVMDGLSFMGRFELGFSLCRHVRDAYRAASSARFEYGESGAVPMTPEEGLMRFVESQCVRGADQEIRPVTFRSAYTEWCDSRKVTAVDTKELTTELRRFGVTLSRGRRPRVYLGLALARATSNRT